VDFLELRRRELVGQALVDFYRVGGVFGTFFEEPDDALGAGFLEPGGLLECGMAVILVAQRVVCAVVLSESVGLVVCVHS
jgi:hypothetical protein